MEALTTPLDPTMYMKILYDGKVVNFKYVLLNSINSEIGAEYEPHQISHEQQLTRFIGIHKAISDMVQKFSNNLLV